MQMNIGTATVRRTHNQAKYKKRSVGSMAWT